MTAAAPPKICVPVFQVKILAAEPTRVKVLVTSIEGNKVETWVPVGKNITYLMGSCNVAGDTVNDLSLAVKVLERFNR